MSDCFQIPFCLAGIRPELFEIHDAFTSIEFNQAAVVKHLSELLPTSLDPGFHARYRQTKAISCFLVCKAIQFYKFDRLSVVI